MKKKITQRLIVFTLASFFIALTANAQGVYQLPNPDFEQWELGVKLDGTVTTTDDPIGWNSFNTAGGRWASMVKVSSITKKEENGNHYVLITARSVLGIVANGNMTTGIINAGGLTATDKGNHNFTVHSDSTNAGASHFGQEFTGHPDAMKVKVKYIPGEEANEEKGKGKDYYQAEISGWIHTDAKFQTPYETDVVGKAVSFAKINPLYDNAREWKEFTADFDYSVGNEGNIPAYVLISCGTNKSPGAGSSKDSLMVDDFYFVYYSSLSDIKINNVSIDGFNETVTEYTMEGSAPDLSEVTAMPKSRWATLENITQTVENGKDVIVITVKGNDFEASGNQTVYKLIYEKATVDVKPIVGTYDGDLTIALGEEKIASKDKISLTEDAPGQIGLHLKDFSLGEGEELLTLGDIDISNIPVTQNGETYHFESEYVPISLMDGAINADVKAIGTVVGNNIDITIEVNAMGLEISVTFIGSRVTSNTKSTITDDTHLSVSKGIVSIQGFEGNLQIFNVSGVNVYSTKVNGTATFTLDKGIYIIKTGDKITKVLIP